jgi:hypothetical protein
VTEVPKVWAHRLPADRSLLATGAVHHEPTVASPVLVLDADSGEPVMYVAKFPGELSAMRRALLTFPMSTTIRAAGIRNKSAVFGYVGRRVMVKRESCRPCATSAKAPEAHRQIVGAATDLHAHLAEVLPERAAADLAAASVVLPDWKLSPSAPWTSGVVNWLSPLPYHYDRNNLDAWSAMPVVRRGVRGGHLHVPEYGLVVACRDGDVVYFAGYDLMHAVTPLRPVDKDGYRVSAVYYSVEDFKACLPMDQEFAAARKRRTERETGLMERQRREGMMTP